MKTRTPRIALVIELPDNAGYEAFDEVAFELEAEPIATGRHLGELAVKLADAGYQQAFKHDPLDGSTSSANILD